ncbi:MAG TPA: calcium/sodium antiporter [Longimicrobiales bacterium]|nr:calcium/sodium antiporter [Longimicrobiales bacterium]
MTAATVLALMGGLVLLTAGAEALVRGASGLARAAGVTPLLVGLTVVAFGTSAPEVAVSVRASLGNQPAVALGNVVGSNVFNVLVILGVSAVVAPLLVQRQLVRQDVPILIGVSFVPILLALDGRIGRIDGLLLLAGGIGYTGWLGWMGLRKAPGVHPPRRRRHPFTVRRWAVGLALVAAGLVGLVAGANLFLKGALALARAMGVSELVIGLTLVAAGTSLPELATSVVATVRGERDIAVGNVVGSNIFNILVVLGAASALGPHGLAVPRGALTFDLPVMMAVAFVCLPIFYTDWSITRGEGALFLSYYGAYLVYLFLHASGHEAETLFGAAIAYVAIPLTLVVGAILWWRDRDDRRRGTPEPAAERRTPPSASDGRTSS